MIDTVKKRLWPGFPAGADPAALDECKVDLRAMSIRLIVKALYRAYREVEKIEKQIQNAPPEVREVLKDRLRKATAERDRMRNILEGRKG